MGKLEDRVAVITGSSRGLGRAIAEGFVAEGARVVLNGRSEEKGGRALAEMDAGEAACFIAADIGSRKGCEGLIAETIDRWGRVDVLVNNAGGTRDVAPVAELSDETLRVTLEWNLWSTFWCSQVALADMIPRGSGRIINVSSVEGKLGSPVTSAYVLSKHAVNGLTKSCAEEVGALGITVNALCPGVMHTDPWDEYGAAIAAERGMTLDQLFAYLSSTAATKRITPLRDVTAVAVLLASDAGAGISGSLISIDGGTAPF